MLTCGLYLTNGMPILLLDAFMQLLRNVLEEQITTTRCVYAARFTDCQAMMITWATHSVLFCKAFAEFPK